MTVPEGSTEFVITAIQVHFTQSVVSVVYKLSTQAHCTEHSIVHSTLVYTEHSTVHSTVHNMVHSTVLTSVRSMVHNAVDSALLNTVQTSVNYTKRFYSTVTVQTQKNHKVRISR